MCAGSWDAPPSLWARRGLPQSSSTRSCCWPPAPQRTASRRPWQTLSPGLGAEQALAGVGAEGDDNTHLRAGAASVCSFVWTEGVAEDYIKGGKLKPACCLQNLLSGQAGLMHAAERSVLLQLCTNCGCKLPALRCSEMCSSLAVSQLKRVECWVILCAASVFTDLHSSLDVQFDISVTAAVLAKHQFWSAARCCTAAAYSRSTIMIFHDW